jgi:transcriptional regulator with XRE-family HTH domain
MPNTSPYAKEPALVAFGAAMRATRVGKGISQEDLANDSGIDRSYLGAIERGEQNAGLLHLVRIAAALDIALADVMAMAGL